MESENVNIDNNKEDDTSKFREVGEGGGDGDKSPLTKQTHVDGNESEDADTEDAETAETITTIGNVNNQKTAVIGEEQRHDKTEEENEPGDDKQRQQQIKIDKVDVDDDDLHETLSLLKPPAGITNIDEPQPIPETTEDDDEESTLIATSFERPFSTPLAPFDMELMDRLKKEQEAKRQSLSSEYKRQRSNTSQRKSINAVVATNMFLEHENQCSDGRGIIDSQAAKRKETSGGSGCEHHRVTPADLAYTNIGGDSEYPATTMAHLGESFHRDSTTSTLLLQDEESRQSGRIVSATSNNSNNNNHTNHQNYLSNNHHRHHQYPRKSPATEELPMTPLAPFQEPTDDDINPPNDFYMKCEKNPSLFFDDGVRSIDFVLVYKINPQPNVEDQHEEKRHIFEMNLLSEGLEIERACKEKEQIYFVKVHAPLEVLRRYAEILKLRMPMKEIPGMSVVNRSTSSVFSSLKGLIKFFMRHIYVDERNFPRRAQRFTAIYSRDKEYLFDIRQDNFFTPAVRSRIVQFILDRQRFTPKSKDEMAFGIERMVASNIYCAGYPLHDGEVTEKNTMRHTLYTHWASVRKWYRYQPLDYIKEYFGVKIGLYFAWLGFYTYMLLLASVVGVFCFIYSWSTLKDFEPVKEICGGKKNITMCPLCEWCDFWDLKETCFYAKISYLIDNPSTVFFAVFMSFWATLFLELWKRYSAEITHRWDLTGFDVHEEHPRPQYLAKLQHLPHTRTDYVTNMREPTVPFWRMKLPAAVFSFSMVLLLVALTLVAVLAVVVYRMATMASLMLRKTNPMNTSSAIVLATSSAAFLNLCMLYVLNYVYNRLAEYLTELEMWRTQTQFDDSLTLKMYLLQFVNYYASIFYVAFYKGKFVGRPGAYTLLFDFRQEECSSGGCLTELCIQLAIIMIGKQAFNSILEVIMPMIWRKIGAIRVGLSKLFTPKEHDKHKDTERWVRDLKLLDWGTRSLFPEYLEMVLQYGFVTIFVAAFPLAPLFALLNNILEMRLDAKKLLTHHRRPVSQRVRDIGVWYRILDCIGKLSVITNGFIIAFTSELIPQWVYRHYSPNSSLEGYLDFSLSKFNTSDSNQTRSLSAKYDNLTTCLYADFREPPTSEKRYHFSNIFYLVLACRLCFVVVFENFVALVMIIVRWCIPDMSVGLRDQIRREAYITNEIIIEQETRRARTERAKGSQSIRLPDSESNTPDPNDRFIRIEQLLCSDLSQSQMDLIIHGSSTETGIRGNEV
ncbi:anoctamin-1 isoform X2 [Musca domestica]|uniref:Anoctamin n=1 Tax=Musca domestica TaxID=7370 RepID=A0A1I8MZX3_MUSDO|nr:anoctamin-1 isoform X2 [Musca domestica]